MWSGYRLIFYSRCENAFTFSDIFIDRNELYYYYFSLFPLVYLQIFSSNFPSPKQIFLGEIFSRWLSIYKFQLSARKAQE